jgi:hypothetical protein
MRIVLRLIDANDFMQLSTSRGQGAASYFATLMSSPAKAGIAFSDSQNGPSRNVRYRLRCGAARKRPCGEGDREGRIQSTHPQRTFQLNAKSLMTSYPGSALGIQIPPQNQVPKRPYFEMRSAGAIKTLPRVSQTDLTSFFRTDRSTHGCAAVTQSSETITSYARLRFSYNRTNSKAKIMPEMTALLKSLISPCRGKPWCPKQHIESRKHSCRKQNSQEYALTGEARQLGRDTIRLVHGCYFSTPEQRQVLVTSTEVSTR